MAGIELRDFIIRNMLHYTIWRDPEPGDYAGLEIYLYVPFRLVERFNEILRNLVDMDVVSVDLKMDEFELVFEMKHICDSAGIDYRDIFDLG